MWSVVTESPSLASTRAPTTSFIGAGVSVIPSKYGGLRTYVDSAHEDRDPLGAATPCHRSSPANTSPYDLRNISDSTESATAAFTSADVGQMSRRYTGSPDEPV